MSATKAALPPILLVEDDLGLSRLFELVVTRARIANPVVAVGCGDDALSYLLSPDAPRPAVVLLDLGLPDIDGLSLLALIRDVFDQRELPVVVLSGSVGAMSVDRAMAAGANLFLGKPVAINELVAALESFGLDGAYEAAS